MFSLFALIVALGPAHPDPSTHHSDWQLDWEVPPGCPDRSQLADHLTAKATEQRPLPRSRVHVRARHDRFEAVVTIWRDGRPYRRELADGDCRALIEAVRLVFDMALDPTTASADPIPVDGYADASASTSPSAVPERSTPDQSNAPTPTNPPPPSTESPPRSPERRSPSIATRAKRRGFAASEYASDPPQQWRISAGLRFGAFLFDRPAGGVMAAVGLGRSRWMGHLFATYWWPQTHGRELGLPVRFSRWALGLRACAAPIVGRLEWSWCLSAEAGSTESRPLAPLTRPRPGVFHLGLEAGTRLTFALPQNDRVHPSGFVDLSGGYTPFRYRFMTSPSESLVFETRTFQLLVTLGISWQLRSATAAAPASRD